MSSVTTDKTATITKQNIHGTSYDQYLSLSYHVTGIGSKITVSLHGGLNTSVLWSSKDSSQLVVNEWKSATVNITTFEKYDVRGCKFVIILTNQHECIKIVMLISQQLACSLTYWFNQSFKYQL